MLLSARIAYLPLRDLTSLAWQKVAIKRAAATVRFLFMNLLPRPVQFEVFVEELFQLVVHGELFLFTPFLFKAEQKSFSLIGFLSFSVVHFQT
jgi:hypothetical protein